MQDLDISYEIIGRVLNHKQSGETKTYTQSEQMRQKADALERWSDHLIELIGIKLEHVKKEAA